MPNDSRLADIEAALASLKDFQRGTVAAVYDRLFVQKQKSMLVADEVGLGKTVVAKGVIATALRERIQSGDHSPFRVTYICSNQVIAGENITKLNVFPKVDLSANVVARISFLAYEPEPVSRNSAPSLLLNTLTPGTSFDVTYGVGRWMERVIIYCLLCSNSRIDSSRNGLALLLRGGVQGSADDLRSWFEWRRQTTKLRPTLPDQFIALLRRPVSTLENFRYTQELLEISCDRRPTLFDITVRMADLLRANNEATHRRACNEVARSLRRALIESCLDFIDADLFILDEFQRFRSLIDQDSQEEEAIIARKVFASRKARILLLSATPFKAFTGDMDHANGEDHYRDFNTVLKFLTKADESLLQQYESHRSALYQQILDLQKDNLNVSTEHRDALQAILRSVMCRTERQIVAADPGAMIDDKWRKEQIPFGQPDILNYVATDQITCALSLAAAGRHQTIGKPIEYCKSAPHPLSYLDGYALKKLLKDCRRNETVRAALKEQRSAWLDVRAVNRYKLVIGGKPDASPDLAGAHARLATLVQEAIGQAGDRLLWIPPNLPYYQLAGPFKDDPTFSKALVFSGWVMVPRMIATLLSYEVERRTVGNPASREAREAAARKYFPPRSKPNYRRHPVPLLVFRSEDGEFATAKNMSNFCCLYPSPTLAALYNPVAPFQPGTALDALRQLLAERMRKLIDQAQLSKYEDPNAPSERWYWAAPILLDHADTALRPKLSHWLKNEDFQTKSTFFDPKDGEQRGKKTHFLSLLNAFESPKELRLGPMPTDLPEVLADMAIGSPAIVALRTLSRLFPDSRRTISYKQWRGAFEIAGAFLNLFNKPESICTVRLATAPADYWRQVLRYGADGCLQAVLDEYGHLTKEQTRTLEATVTRIQDTVNITASSINVDSYLTFMRGRPAHKMRCHYAVDFGNQKLETDEGQKRATSIRENFNSPFRPFVLATTSIGQEGLDFHQYCRKIVHWNLPGNPIDLEQREGRINRYKGMVIRQELAHKYASQLPSDCNLEDPWTQLFAIADREERVKRGKCELVPYWHVDTEQFKIERIIPMYPFSRDHGKLRAILKTLAIYRLAFGQPRQVELIEHLLQKDFSSQEIDKIRNSLMIDLSPISHQGNSHADKSNALPDTRVSRNLQPVLTNLCQAPSPISPSQPT
jgi:hypothetical protein